MRAKIRVGLVGTGDIGRLHARALQKRDDVELCVCRGVKAAGAEAFARDFGAKVYPSYVEMLGDPGVLAVDICVPNDLHRTYVEQAASAGKHILCEKPIALTLEDANAMVVAEQQAKVVLMIAHPLRFWDEYVRLREVLHSRELGACQAITMRRMLSLLMNVSGEGAWRRNPGRMGGAVIDLQIHDLDFLYWTFGLPETVYCAATPSESKEFNHSYTTLKYASGLIAMVESSYLLKGDPMIFTTKAICERGTLDYQLNLQNFNMHAIGGTQDTASEARAASLICYRAGGGEEILARQQVDVFDSSFAAEISYFVDCVLYGGPNTRVPVADAIATLKIALAAKESAMSGAVVRMS
jgi:UDP-N-acetylglucosamine 3-dehydrogenase